MISIVNDKHDDTIENLKKKYPNSKRIYVILHMFYHLLTRNKNSYKLYTCHCDNYYYVYVCNGYSACLMNPEGINIQVFYRKQLIHKYIQYNSKYFLNNNIKFTTKFKLFILRNYCSMQDKFYNVNWLYIKNINTIKNINMLRLYRNIYFI